MMPLDFPQVFFGGDELKNAPSRAAMGYPEYFVPAVSDEFPKQFAELRLAPMSKLLSVVEAPESPIAQRYAAGLWLAFIGDPRIDVLQPSMKAIPRATVELGLRNEEFNSTCDSLSPLGVHPDWIKKETPSYQITLPAFFMSKYPVTNQEFLQFMKETSYPEIPTSWSFGKYPNEKANHPVYTVTATAAEAYAKWLAKRTGKSYRLPTEAEWEYAASGGDRRNYPWGKTFAASKANTVEAGFLSTTPVGIFVEGNSPFGLADMAGNVEEYVADDYQPYPGGTPPADDLVQANGSYRVARGGSFTRFHDLARCVRRHGRYPKDIYVMGFRLALSASA